MAALYFGEFLISMGEVTEAEIDQALAGQGQRHLRMGERAVLRGYMGQEQVEDVRACQESDGRLFGEIAVTMDFLTVEQVESLEAAREAEHTRLGQALVREGVLSAKVLEALLLSYDVYRSQLEDSVSSRLSAAPHASVVNALLQSIKVLLPRHGLRGCLVADVHIVPRAVDGITWTTFRTLAGEAEVKVAFGVGIPTAEAITRVVSKHKGSQVLPERALDHFLQAVCEGALARLPGNSLSLGRGGTEPGDGFRRLMEFISLKELTQVTLKLAPPVGPASLAFLTVATVR